jgi:plasmid stability protein
MAQLIVRNIEKSIVLKLKRRAAKEGVSMEEAHRQLLRLSLRDKPKPKMSFLDFLCTAPDFGENADDYRKKWKMRKIDLD